MTLGKEKIINSDDDINFYKIAYRKLDNPEIFTAPTLIKEKEYELNILMTQLKKMIKDYPKSRKDAKKNLEEYINRIAFLFKSEVYKSENEIRLVVKGDGFEKIIDTKQHPPGVYINLFSLKHDIKIIAIGPKVERPDEWAAAFHYSYDKEDLKPEILISHLPFK